MAGFGWHNGWPFQWGGGPSDAEAIYRAMRNAVGDGGAGPEDGIEDCWRQARAIGLAAAGAGNLRATMQGFPRHASDALPYFEEVLGLPAGPDDHQAERQERVADAWYSERSGVLQDLLLELQRIDATFAYLHPGWDKSTTTRHGRFFAPRDGSEPFGFADGRAATAWPNESDMFRSTALLPLADPTQHGPVVLKQLEQARALLGDSLPAWEDFYLVTDTGFTLDSSPLDLTGLLET